MDKSSAAGRGVWTRPTPEAGMADDADADTRDDLCPVLPCPYCALNVRHDVDMDGLYACWNVINNEANRIYMENAVNHRQKQMHLQAILLRMGHTMPPPPPPPPGPLTCWTAWSGAPAADAATGAASSFDGMPAPWIPWTSYRDYSWQFRSGRKQKTWSDYDDAYQTTIETTFGQGRPGVDLTIDTWDYAIDFQAMTQMSRETNMTRGVRRVTRDEAMLESKD